MVLAGRGRAQWNVVDAAGIFSGHWTSSLSYYVTGRRRSVTTGRRIVSDKIHQEKERVAIRSTQIHVGKSDTLMHAALRGVGTHCSIWREVL
jgi:hypothetical protein